MNSIRLQSITVDVFWDITPAPLFFGVWLAKRQSIVELVTESSLSRTTTAFSSRYTSLMIGSRTWNEKNDSSRRAGQRERVGKPGKKNSVHVGDTFKASVSRPWRSSLSRRTAARRTSTSLSCCTSWLTQLKSCNTDVPKFHSNSTGYFLDWRRSLTSSFATKPNLTLP